MQIQPVEWYQVELCTVKKNQSANRTAAQFFNRDRIAQREIDKTAPPRTADKFFLTATAPQKPLDSIKICLYYCTKTECRLPYPNVVFKSEQLV